MATLQSLPPEILLKIFSLLAQSSLSSFKALALTSSQFARIYHAHQDILLPISIKTYLGLFLGPALALARLDSEEHVPKASSMPEMLRQTIVQNPPMCTLKELKEALDVHETVIETLVLTTNHRYQRGIDPLPPRPLSEQKQRLRTSIRDRRGYNENGDLTFQDVIDAYEIFIHAGIRAAGRRCNETEETNSLMRRGLHHDAAKALYEAVDVEFPICDCCKGSLWVLLATIFHIDVNHETVRDKGTY